MEIFQKFSWVLALISFALFLNSVSPQDFAEFEGSFSTESGDVVSLIREELENLRVDLTKSFIAEHSRRKRDALGHVIEPEVSGTDPLLKIKDSSNQVTCNFLGEVLIFQSSGLFRLDQHSSKAELVKLNGWTLDHGDEILNTYEWDDTLYILTSNKKLSYSRLYTLQSPDFAPVSRQQIRHQGFASAAQFFKHLRDLYMIITMDNDVHTLTISPIYRWTKTYMDQIHEIQTRGASAVKVFPINSFKYIAIAQSQDAAGNFEVGIPVLKMFRRGEIEKVQLLWSNEPVALAHVRILKEDYLIVGQRREPAIVYWYGGGRDFIHWQTLEGYMGNKLFLDTLVLPDGEPVLLAGNENSVKFFSRVALPQVKSQSNGLVLNFTLTAYEVETDEILSGGHFLKVKSGTNFLTVTTTHPKAAWENQLRVFEVKLTERVIGSSQVEDPDKLTLCLTKLTNRLDQDDPPTLKLEGSNSLIVTRNRDLTFSGAIVVSNNGVTLPSKNTNVKKSAVVQPNIASPEDKYTSPPSEIIAIAEKQKKEFDKEVGSKLSNLLLKTVAGDIIGNKIFNSPLTVKDLRSSTTLELTVLNDVPWSEYLNKMLKTKLKQSERAQIISGNWDIQNLKTEKFESGDHIGNVAIDNFLLKSCSSGNSRQTVQGTYNFNDDVNFKKELNLGPFANINDIKFSDIVMRSKSFGTANVRGYKHADFVNGRQGFETQRINGINLQHWFNSALKIEGEDQICSDLKTFAKITKIDSMQVVNINDHNWDQFVDSVVLSGPNQTIQGDLKCKKIVAIEVTSETVNGIRVDDLLTTTTPQEIKSEIIVTDLKVRGDMEVEMVNGDSISDAVLSTEDAEILGPVQIQKFSVKDVLVDEKITISSIDVSEAAKMQKTHHYSSANSEAFHIKSGHVSSNELHASALNTIEFHNIRNEFWRVDANNVIPNNMDFTSAGKVEIQDKFSTRTLNGLKPGDLASISGNNEEIRGNLQFEQPVIVEGDVDCSDRVKLNEFDFSEVSKQIIRTTDAGGRRITGHKVFQDTIEARKGIKAHLVNGIRLENEVVLLNGFKNQKISGRTKIRDVLAEDVWSRTDIEVGGTVNGQNLKKIGLTTAYNNAPVHIEGDITFQNDITANDLHVRKEINGQVLDEVIKNSMDLSKPQKITTDLHVEGTVRFTKDSSVHLINGVNVVEHLSNVFNRESDVLIKGKKRFENLVIEGDLENCVSVNGIDVLDLEKFAFSKTKSQTLTGNMLFQKLHSEDNLITERIDGILLSDLVQTDEKSEISSEVEFQSAETKFDQNIITLGKLNGFKISEVAAGIQTLNGSRRFHTVTIDGNLSWLQPKLGLRRFSYIYQDAVTKDSDQTIKGRIAFDVDVKVDSVESEKWINGINLGDIQDDAVFLNQPPVFTGKITFTQNPTITFGSAHVKSKLDASLINSISLKALDKQVVRLDFTDVVKGMKTFEAGLSVQHLLVTGSIDNIHPEDLVRKGDTRTIDKVSVENVRIKKDLTFTSLEGDRINKILQNRIDLSKTQTVLGQMEFLNDVIVEECTANPINGIDESDLLRKNAKFLQNIRGEKIFKNLRIEGNVEGTSINGIFLDQLNNQIFRLNQNEVFERHVIFKDTVLVSHVNVTNGINSIDFEKMQAEFSTQVREFVDPVHVSESTKEKTLEKIEELGKSLKCQAFWFNDYSLPIKYLPGLEARDRVEYFIPKNHDFVKIAMHQHVVVGEGKETKCNLPDGCLCKSIQFLELRENDQITKAGEAEAVNIFELQAPSGQAYIVTSEVVSYNRTCTSDTEVGTTDISQLLINAKGQQTNQLLAQIQTGFIKDAKIFTDKGKDYIVLAQFYDFKARTHKTDVIILEISNENVRKIQSIKANGAKRLALEKVGKDRILAIANSKAGLSVQDCKTGSTIYMWSNEEEKADPQFIFLKKVETVGAVDVTIHNVPNHWKLQNSFVVFAETVVDAEEWRSLGKVSIYGFEQESDSTSPQYSLFQTLDFDHPVYALYSVSVRKQSYLFVISYSEVMIFKYLHYEGFKKFGSIQIDGVRDTNVINWKKKLTFVSASTEVSLISEAVLSGSLEVH